MSTNTAVDVVDDAEWIGAWRSLAISLDLARQVTGLIKNGQTTSVKQRLRSLTEAEYFRVASGVTADHPHVQRGRAALLERHPEHTAPFYEVWANSSDGIAQGHLLHSLVAGVLAEMVAEFGGRPDAPIGTDERIRQESIWCWHELVLGGLNGRESVGSKSYAPNEGVYPNTDTPKSRKDWALRRTRATGESSVGEKYAAESLVRQIGSAIEPDPRQSGPADSLSVLDRMLPPSLAAATRRRLARHTGTPKLTNYQAEAIPVLAKALPAGENLLLSAVTGSGKSLLGQLAAGYVVGRRELGHRNRRAVIALPLKALVGDVVTELKNWFSDAGLAFKVLGGSRDYPENVEDLAAGRYEVAVMIYETLEGYLSSGQDPLKGCGVLIVDELQYLDDETRGPRLESMLTKVRLGYPNLPIVGISAVLSQESRTRLSAWLDVDDERHLHTSRRPVSLDVRAFDGFAWRKLRDMTAVHDSGDDEDTRPVEEAPLDLRSQVNSDWAQDGDANRQIIGPATRGGNVLAPAVVVHKLNENPDSRILVYTRSRASAYALSRAIQAAMDREFGPVMRTRTNPWRYGRYCDAALSPEVADERRQRLLRTAAHGARKDVETALMTGCAYHTRQLTRPLRELVQDEFRKGLLRVLVTTDTLSVGLNLPVDIVVVASTTVSTGGANGELRSLGLGEIKNRIGRAGRLGLSESGDAWLLTEDADYLHKKLRTDDDVDVHTLSTTDGLWERFIVPQHGGTDVASRMTTEDLALLVLQDMTAKGRIQSLDSHERRAAEVMGATLLANLAPHSLPLPDQIVAHLVNRSLMISPDARGWKASPLGVAIAVNNLPLSTGPVLECIADLAASGASELELFRMAATSTPVRRLNWVSVSGWNPDWTHGDLEQQTIKSIRDLIAPVCEEDRASRASADERLLRQLRSRDPDAVLVPMPDAVIAEEQQVTGDTLDDSAGPSLAEANVVLRALVAYLWRHGVPFTELKGRIEAGTRYERDRARRSWGKVRKEIRRAEVHLADIEQLCDQVSNILGAADHFARHRVTGTRTQRLQSLAEAMWAGVPSWLTPLLDLHVEALHRERLLGVAGDAIPEELRDLLADERLGLSQPEIEAAQAALDARDRRLRPEQAHLPIGLNDKPVADNPDAPTYGDYFVDLSQAQGMSTVVDVLVDLLEQHHLVVETAGDRVTFHVPSGPAATLVLAADRVTSATVQGVLVDEAAPGETRALLCLSGMTDRARSVAQSALEPGRLVLTGVDSLLILLNRSLRAGQDAGTPVAEAVLSTFSTECGQISVVVTSS